MDLASLNDSPLKDTVLTFGYRTNGSLGRDEVYCLVCHPGSLPLDGRTLSSLIQLASESMKRSLAPFTFLPLGSPKSSTSLNLTGRKEWNFSEPPKWTYPQLLNSPVLQKPSVSRRKKDGAKDG